MFCFYVVLPIAQRYNFKRLAMCCNKFMNFIIIIIIINSRGSIVARAFVAVVSYRRAVIRVSEASYPYFVSVHSLSWYTCEIYAGIRT